MSGAVISWWMELARSRMFSVARGAIAPSKDRGGVFAGAIALFSNHSTVLHTLFKQSIIQRSFKRPSEAIQQYVNNHSPVLQTSFKSHSQVIQQSFNGPSTVVQTSSLQSQCSKYMAIFCSNNVFLSSYVLGSINGFVAGPSTVSGKLQEKKSPRFPVQSD